MNNRNFKALGFKKFITTLIVGSGGGLFLFAILSNTFAAPSAPVAAAVPAPAPSASPHQPRCNQLVISREMAK